MGLPALIFLQVQKSTCPINQLVMSSGRLVIDILIHSMFAQASQGILPIFGHQSPLFMDIWNHLDVHRKLWRPYSKTRQNENMGGSINVRYTPKSSIFTGLFPVKPSSYWGTPAAWNSPQLGSTAPGTSWDLYQSSVGGTMLQWNAWCSFSLQTLP